MHLNDGTRVVLRLIQPSDKDLLLDGFQRLSPESRYARFLGPKDRLTPDELRYLTEVDGHDHFAIVALRHPLLGAEEGIGVARFIRLKRDAQTAEPAITVTDDQQGKGLGTILLHRLLEAAWERGIRQFRCRVLSKNTQIRELLATIEADVHVEEVKDGAVVVSLPVESPTREAGETGALRPWLRRLLSHVAQDLISVIPEFARPSQEPDA